MATQEELLSQTQGFRDEAEGFAQSADISKTQAQSARVQAQAARDTAEQHKSDALQAVTDATAQYNLTVSVRDTAVVARNEVIAARTTVNTKSAEAAVDAASALAARTAALAAQTKAENWADYPKDQIVPGESSYSARHWAEVAYETTSGGQGTVVFYGAWDAAIDGTPPTPDISARYYITSDGVIYTDGLGGVIAANVYEGDTITYSVPDAEWFITSGSGSVASVNGYTGGVTLDYGDFAGTESITLNNSIYLRSKSTGGSVFGLARIDGDNHVALGTPGLVMDLNASAVPNWTNGTTTYSLIHSGGGQIVGGTFETTGTVIVPQINSNDITTGNKQVIHPTSGLIYFGNPLTTAQIESDVVPKIKIGTASVVDLVHTGGGQAIDGSLKVQTFQIDGAAGNGIDAYNGANATYIDLNMPEVTVDSANIRAFRATTTTGTRRFDIYKGDGTSTLAFRVDAGNQVTYVTGDLKINGNDALHTGGSQTVDGALTVGGNLKVTGAGFQLDNDRWIQSKDSGGSYQSLARLNSGNVAIYGYQAAAGLQLSSSVAPVWHDGTTARTLLHTGGGQAIAGNLTVQNHLRIPDSVKLLAGTGDNHQFWHNGSAAYIDNYNGASYIRNLAQGNLILQVRDTSDVSHTVFQAQSGTARPYARLFEDGVERLRTTSSGVDVYGSLVATGDLNNVGKSVYTDTVILSNFEKSSLITDGQLGFDASQGLLIYRTQQGWDGAVTVLDQANVNAGTGISISDIDNAVTGTNYFTFSLDTIYTDGRYLGINAKADDSNLLDGLNSSSFTRAGARTDNYVWPRRNSSGVNATLFVTQQGTGYVADFRQGAGDGTSVFIIGNDGQTYFTNAIHGNSKTVAQTHDTWLRLNEPGHFTSGIYCGSTGVLRHDGGIHVGANKSVLSHSGTYGSGQVTFSTSAPSGGSNGDIWYQY